MKFIEDGRYIESDSVWEKGGLKWRHVHSKITRDGWRNPPTDLPTRCKSSSPRFPDSRAPTERTSVRCSEGQPVRRVVNPNLFPSPLFGNRARQKASLHSVIDSLQVW